MDKKSALLSHYDASNEEKKALNMERGTVFQQNMLLYSINAPVCAIYLVTKPDFMIGSALDCDAVLRFSREVSRHHARIIWNNGTYMVEDLGSTNHTFINGDVLAPNQPQPLQNRDQVSFASFSFEVKVANL